MFFGRKQAKISTCEEERMTTDETEECEVTMTEIESVGKTTGTTGSMFSVQKLYAGFLTRAEHGRVVHWCLGIGWYW